VTTRIKKIIDFGNTLLCSLLFYPYIIRYHVSRNKYDKLHVGCGKNRFKAWINADIHPKADLIIFLQKKLPFKENSLKRIYTEHVLEHVSYDSGVFFLKEARRSLQLGGVIRIAMPDLDALIDGYQKDWRTFDWVNWTDFSFIKTRAEMINIAFRWWGHQHLYNKEELARALTEAGFTTFYFVERNQSKFENLRGLETRLDSTLIVEAEKN
jgi:predicted SAM-dependent methyltransferase